MTTVTVYEGQPFRMRVEGHAGASAGGFDPVCAGASMLAWTLTEAATDKADYHARLHIDELTPVIEVRCEPESRSRKSCEYLFSIIRGGFDLLAEQYPDHIQIDTKEDTET